MIPYKIHYIWFGGDKPELVQRCTASLECLKPDFEVIEWNESNYDIKKLAYSERIYSSGVLGLSVCQARFDILYQQGGIYLDTDIELVNHNVSDWKKLLENKSLIFELETNELNINRRIGTAFMAGEQGHPFLKRVVTEFDKVERRFMTSPRLLTRMLIQDDLPSDLTILSSQYFSPMTWEEFVSQENQDQAHVEMNDYITPDTLGFHWYQASWHSKTKQIR